MERLIKVDSVAYDNGGNNVFVEQYNAIQSVKTSCDNIGTQTNATHSDLYDYTAGTAVCRNNSDGSSVFKDDGGNGSTLETSSKKSVFKDACGNSYFRPGTVFKELTTTGATDATINTYIASITTSGQQVTVTNITCWFDGINQRILLQYKICVP